MLAIRLLQSKPLLVSSSLDLKMMLWDADSLRLVNYFTPANCPVYCFKLSADESQIFAVSEDSSVKVWRLEQPQLTESIPGFSCSLSNECFDVCEELKLIAGLAKNDLKEVVVYDSQNKAIAATLKGHSEIVNCILISAKRKMLFSGGDDNAVRIHGLDHFQLLFHLERLHMSDVRSLTLDSSESFLLTAGHDKRFNLVSLDSPNRVIGSGRIKQRINKIRYLGPSQEVICISDEKQRFYVWSLNLSTDQKSSAGNRSQG